MSIALECLCLMVSFAIPMVVLLSDCIGVGGYLCPILMRACCSGKAALAIQQVLIKMGHKQPPTPIQSDNNISTGIANEPIK